MKPATYETLLKALQKLEKALVKAGVAAARADKALHERLRHQHILAETGGSLDDYVELVAGRSAVQLLLRTVYVRVIEDLGLLDPPRIRGERGVHAFREVAPALGVRSYLRWVFRDLASDFPALFTHGDGELPLPAEELCREILEALGRQGRQGQSLLRLVGRRVREPVSWVTCTRTSMPTCASDTPCSRRRTSWRSTSSTRP